MSAKARKLRIAAVSFTNARPLLEGLASEPGLDLVLATPARCADLLQAGRVDAALIPAVVWLEGRGRGLVRVSRGVVAAERRVRTVLVVADRPLAEVRTVRLSAASRTSNALVRVLGPALAPRAVLVAPDAPADAAVVIGDPAFKSARRHAHVVDLAAAWRRLTGLPFVFATFCARAPIPGLEALLDRARARGLAGLDRIALAAAAELGEDPAVMQAYFTEDLHFEATERDEQGLALFGRQIAAAHHRRQACETPARAS